MRERAIEAALAAPYALHPLTSFPPLVGALWADGRRIQAAFWFYVFQERSAAWALADDEGRGSGAAALRTAMNDQLGQVINPRGGGRRLRLEADRGARRLLQGEVPALRKTPRGDDPA